MSALSTSTARLAPPPIFNDIDVATAAGSARGAFAPVTLAYDAFITATVAGAAQTGTLDVITTFEFKGK